MTNATGSRPGRRRVWPWILGGLAAAFVALVVLAAVAVFWIGNRIGGSNVPMEIARMVEQMNPGTELGVQRATAAALPDWIPRMDGIDVSGFTSQGGGLLMGTAAGSAQDVLAFYARELVGAGLEIPPGGITESEEEGMVQASSADGCRSVLVAVGEEGGATQVSYQFNDCANAPESEHPSPGGWTRPLPPGPPRSEGEVRVRLLHTFTEQGGFIRSLDFSADGSLLASASTDGSIRVWNLASGEETLAHQEQGRTSQRFPYLSLALHPQGELLAHGSRGDLLLRDATTGTTVHTIAAGAEPVGQARFDGDGDVLALATLEPSGVQVFTAGPEAGLEWTLSRRLSLESAAEELAISPSGERLAFAVPCVSLELWDAAEGREIGSIRARALDLRLCGEYFAAAFSPDLTLAANATDSPEIYRWDLARGRSLGKLVNPRGGNNLEGVTALAFDPRGEVLAAGTVDGRVELWDWSAESLRGELFDVTGSDVARISYSRDGRLMAVGDWYGVVRVVEIE